MGSVSQPLAQWGRKVKNVIRHIGLFPNRSTIHRFVYFLNENSWLERYAFRLWAYRYRCGNRGGGFLFLGSRWYLAGWLTPRAADAESTRR